MKGLVKLTRLKESGIVESLCAMFDFECDGTTESRLEEIRI